MKDDSNEGRNNGPQGEAGEKPAPVRAERVIVSRGGAEVHSSPPLWLWEGRIPAGEVTLIIGCPGAGKSYLMADLAASVTTGDPVYGSEEIGKGDVAFLAAEDDPATAIIPRVLAQGGAADNLHFLDEVCVDGSLRPLQFPGDAHTLGEWLGQHLDVVLVVIDPLSAYLTSGNSSGARAAMNALTKVAREQQVAIVAICHTKPESTPQRPVLQGYSAVLQVARMAWLVTRHPDNEHQGLLLPYKTNLANPAGLSFRITGEGVQWGGEVPRDSSDPTRSDRQFAKEFLRTELAEADWASFHIMAVAKKAGISQRTLERARAELGVVSYRDKFCWYWTLPR